MQSDRLKQGVLGFAIEPIEAEATIYNLRKSEWSADL